MKGYQYALMGMLGVTLLGAPAGTRAAVLFTSRENVNILNSYTADLSALQQTIFPGLDVDNLRSSFMEGTFWDGGANPAGGTNSVTINFGTSRNLKTINMSQFPGSEATTMTVETSPDGSTWTPQTATFTPAGVQAQLVLNSAADAQYLRLAATAINDGNGANRWVLTALRVFGGTGTLNDAGGTVDLVSGTGGPGGGTVTLTRNGTVSETDTTDSEFVNDALYPIKRQVLFSMGAGDGFTLNWSSADPINFKRLGLFFDPSHIDASAAFTVETSLDGSSYATVLTQTGGITQGMEYFALTPSVGKYLRFTYTGTSLSDNRISDIQVFGDLVSSPEPSTLLLLGVGGLMVFRRRRWHAAR